MAASPKVRFKNAIDMYRIIVLSALLLGLVDCIHFDGSPSQYAIYPKWDACVNASLKFEFKSLGTQVGLLAYTDDSGKYDFMQLSLDNGKVNLTLNIVDGHDGSVQIVAGENLDDRRWHKVTIERKRMETTLTVDDVSESKVSVGSDFHFGKIETNSPVYIGGLPATFLSASEMKRLSLPSAAFLRGRFRGEIRNVLYRNCTCQEIRAEVVSSVGVSRDPKEACEVENTCDEGCICISTDDRPGCDCSPLRCEAGAVTYYHLPMNILLGDTVVNPSGLDSLVNGEPQLVEGVSGKALSVSGRRQWLTITGPGHRYECFGDLDQCPMGYTVMLWVKFSGVSDTKGVYLSNGGHSDRSHGIAMLYGNGALEFIFKNKQGEQWSVEYDNILTEHWYHVTATWKRRNGLLLYINGNMVSQDSAPARKPAVRDNSRNNNFILGRANDYSGLSRVGTIAVDEFQFWSSMKSPQDIRELGPIYNYYLSMDQSADGALEAPNLNGKSVGPVSRVSGKIGSAISLSGGGDYVDFGPHSHICLGNMEKCIYGFYISMWIKFNKLESTTYFVATGPKGLSVYYTGNRLYAELTSSEKKWKTYGWVPEVDRWYFLEVSWDDKSSLSMFIDLDQASVGRDYTSHRPRETSHQNFYIGRANTPMNEEKYAAAVVDEFDIFYADRQTLISIGFIQRGKPTNFYFDFDEMRGSRVTHPAFVINTYGSPKLVRGKIRRALSLNGNSQTADIGEHKSKCLGNLDYCVNGAMQAFWLRPGDLQNEMYYLSNGLNGFSLRYSRGRLHVTATTSTRQWTVSVPMMMSEKWHFLEFSWHAETGLQLFSNQQLVGESKRGVARTLSRTDVLNPRMNHFYIGRGNTDMNSAAYANATFDDLEYWYSTREFLLAHDYIQRGEPMNYLLSMEEIRNNRLVHPTLRLPVMGNPKIVTGRVGNALRLNGKGQYVDMGEHQDKCLGNLALCNHGITVAFWVNFQNFENDMYYFSSGNNGIQIYHRDQHVIFSVNQPGKTWRVAIPRAEWFRAATWYFVELSWHPDHGLNVYINYKHAKSDRDPSNRELSGDAGNVYLGRANLGDSSGRYVYADATFDEMEIWYGRRETLQAFDYILRDFIGYETFFMERASRGIIDHPKFTVTLVNGGKIVGGGKIGNAADLNGNRQYINLGEHHSRCMGNLEHCKHGLTISLYLKARRLQDDVYFLSSPSYSLYYKNGRLYSSFMTKQKTWTTSTTKFRPDVWELVEMSWHKDKGIVLRLNEAEVGRDTQPTLVQNDQPDTSPVYVGKSVADSRQEKYANVLVDEVEYHYSSIDNLDARGITDRDPIRHEIFHTGRIQGNIMEHPNRRVVVYGRPRVVDAKLGRGAYLNGRSQYIDLGDNVPCQGSLERCPRGFTLRFDVKPEQLLDNQYFIGSNPVSVYYKDGRIYAVVRTDERTYTVSSRGFDRGKWQRVEVSYSPETGVQLYLNGQLASFTNQYTQTPIRYDTSTKTYIGRSTSDMARERYSDAVFEDVEFWDVRRDYLSDAYVDTTPTPTRPSGTNPSRSGTPVPTVNPISNEMKRIAEFDGQSYIGYDFNRIERRFFQKVPTEELRFQLSTRTPNGLVWFAENNKRKLHLSLRDGRLVFFVDYADGVYETVTFPDRQLDDGRYHSVQIKREGRLLRFFVDGREVRSINLKRDLEFLSPGDVLVGGSPQVTEKTDNLVRTNFKGFLGDFDYEKRGRGLKMTVELFALIVPGSKVTIHTGGTPPTIPFPVRTTPRPISTKKPEPRDTAITFKVSGSYLKLPAWNISPGSTISFNFRTVEPRGLIMFNGGLPSNPRFVAVEIFDRKLYFVYDFGGVTTRQAFSDKIVNDGDFHNVKIGINDENIELSLDRTRKFINLPNGDNLDFKLSGPLFIGFVDRAERIPWYVWSQEGFKGCIEDLRVNYVIIDLHDLVRNQFPLSVEKTCVTPFPQCIRSQPCLRGTCYERWDGYFCDCSATAYTGRNCDKVSPVATLDGFTSIHKRFSKTQTTHIDDISLQFRTPLADALLFQTKEQGSNRHIKVYLENGRIKFETNIGGERKVSYFGEGLNDNDWHTLYIKRRAGHLEVWVDREEHKIDDIPGENFYLNVDHIRMGTLGNHTSRKHKHAFIGHLRNFYYNGQDIFRNMNTDYIVIPESNRPLPPIIFYPVTFRTREAFATLPSISRDSLSLSFMFKTAASSGLILYNPAEGNKFIGVELNYGRIQFVLSDGLTTYLGRVGDTYSLNDNKWHYVLIQRLPSGDHRVMVDDKVTKVSTPGGTWNFNERLFIGGLPDRKFDEEKISGAFSSRQGFKGCIASLNFNGYVPDFLKDAKFDKSAVSQGCLDPSITCGPNSCRNFGICVQEYSGFWCNCNMTSYVGTGCAEYGVGYRVNQNDNNGVIIYKFPAGRHPNTNADELAFGFKTYNENGVLTRIESSILDDFIELRLEDGYVVAVYNMGDKEHKLINNKIKYNDGLYHVVRFYRNSDNTTLFVDNYPGVVVDNTGESYVFNRQAMIHLGAFRQGSGALQNKFNGIIAGYYFNGIRALDLARYGGSNVRTYENVIFVPPPLALDKDPPVIGPEIPVVTSGVLPGKSGPAILPLPTADPLIIVPSDVGGVGVAWGTAGSGPGAGGGPGASGGGLIVGVHPIGTGGTGGLSGAPVTGALATAGGPGAGGIFTGARAGAVVGTVLGVLALLSSLMWAFYRCKPGWCPGCGPSPSPATPLDISAPRGGSNMAVVQAKTSGGFMGGGGKTTTVTTLNGTAASAGGGQYASYYGASNAQASAGSADTYDSATLRATGTFSNKGTVIGTPKAERREFGGGSYSSSTVRHTSSSFSDGQQLSPGPPPVQYNTIGGAYGNNTLSSSYQYQVQNVRTVSMGQHSLANAGLPAGAITLQGPAAEEIRVDCCLITSDGRSVITGSYIGTPHVWDMSNGELLRFMKGNTNGSTDLHLACNDRLLVGDVNTDVDVNEFSNRKGVMNRKLQIWDFQSGRPLEMGGDEYCSALCVMSDGDKVVFARTNQMGSSTSVVVWDLLGNQMIKEMRYDAPLGNNDHVCFLALSQNDRYVVAGFRNTIDGQANYVVFDMTLTSYNIVEPSLLMLDAEPDVTVTLPRDEAVTGLRNGDLVIWNLRNGRSSRQLLSNSGHHAHSHEVKALALSEDNRFLVSASADGTLKLWDMATEKQAYTLTGHGDEVWCCAISCDNEIIVSGSRDGTIRLWRLKTGTQMCVFNAQLDIFSISMSRDKGTIVALADKYGTRKLIMLQVVRTKSTRKYSL